MNKEKIILDTDMYNEVDDQFALTYLMKSQDQVEVEAITIAPFSKSGYAREMSIADGTEKSYKVTLDLLDKLGLPDKKGIVYKGAIKYSEESEEDNEATTKIIEIANRNVSTTILAIGAITNVALAILKSPKIISKIKVVWLGGNSFLAQQKSEFNLRQDKKAARIVFESGVDLTVIPCRNVAANLTTTIYELEHYLTDDLGKYLCQAMLDCKKDHYETEEDQFGSSKTIWDISAVAYVLDKSWFVTEKVSCPIILENGSYELTTGRHLVTFVGDLYRNKIFRDFFLKMRGE